MEQKEAVTMGDDDAVARAMKDARRRMFRERLREIVVTLVAVAVGVGAVFGFFALLAWSSEFYA